MWHEPGVFLIYSVRPLDQSVLKVKPGRAPLDRGSDISDCFESGLQAPRNLGIRETMERPKTPLSAPVWIQHSGPEWGPEWGTSLLCDFGENDLESLGLRLQVLK